MGLFSGVFKSLFGDGGAGAARQAAEEARAAEERARQEAAAREAERKANIARSTGHINEQFTRFDDPYFGSIADAYEQFYFPQLDEQASEARRSLALNPAGGSRASSAHARRMGEFEKDYERERSNIANAALDQAQQARGRVEDSRGRLLSSAEAGESFDSIAARTSSTLPTLAAPKSYSPIADLFARYTGAIANAKMAADAGYEPVKPLLFNNRRPAERTVS